MSDYREKDWADPTGQPEIRKVITDTYLLMLANLSAQSGSFAMLQLAFEMYEDGLHDKVLDCLDLVSQNEETKCIFWLNFAERYVQDGKYEIAMHCVERIVSHGKEHTLSAMQSVKALDKHHMILRFMFYLKASPDWFPKDEAIAEALSYKSHRVAAYILKRQNVPIEEWVKILNSMTPTDAASFIVFMNDALKCDWNTLHLNPEIDYLRWPYLTPKFELSAWLNTIVLALKKNKRYLRFEDSVTKGDYWLNRDRYEKLRTQTMESVLAVNGFTTRDVEAVMQWPLETFDPQGWYTRSVEPLNLNEDRFSAVLAVNVNVQTDEVSCLIGVGEEGTEVLDCSDIAEVMSRGQIGMSFSLDQIDGKTRLNPLQKGVFKPAQSISSKYAMTAFVADYLLKEITTGAEVSVIAPFALREADRFLLQRLPEEMRAEITRLRSNMFNSAHKVHRFWIEAERIKYYDNDEASDDQTIYFGRCKMVVKVHGLQYDPASGILQDTADDPASDSPEAQFAKYLSDNYEAIGRAFPVWRRLQALVNLEAMSRIVQNNYIKQTQSIDTSRTSIEAKLEEMKEYLPKNYRRAEDFSKDNIKQKCEKRLLKKVHPERLHLVPREIKKAVKVQIRQELIDKDRNAIQPIVDALSAQYHFEGDLTRPLKDWLFRETDIDPVVDLLKKAADDYLSAISERMKQAYQTANIALEPKPTPIQGECTLVPAAFSFFDKGHYVYGGVNTMNVKMQHVKGPPPFNPPERGKSAPFQSHGSNNNHHSHKPKGKDRYVRPRYVEGTTNVEVAPAIYEGKKIITSARYENRGFANMTCLWVVPGQKLDTRKGFKIKKMPFPGATGRITGSWVPYMAPNADSAKNTHHYTVHKYSRHVHTLDGEAECISLRTNRRKKYNPKELHSCYDT